MNNKLFVGNLSWGATEDSLKAFFAQIGDVLEVKIIIDRATGRSKGFGFVTMATEEDAQKAIAELDQKELDGRPVKVTIALPPKERSF